jgi:hypothetical protein
MQLTTTESSRAWETISQVAKAANASEDFNGENWIHFSMPSLVEKNKYEKNSSRWPKKPLIEFPTK